MKVTLWCVNRTWYLYILVVLSRTIYKRNLGLSALLKHNGQHLCVITLPILCSNLLFNIKYINNSEGPFLISYILRRIVCCNILYKYIQIYCTSTYNFQSGLPAHFEVFIHLMSTINTVNGEMDSKGTPSAGDLLNVQSCRRAVIQCQFLFIKLIISSKVPESPLWEVDVWIVYCSKQCLNIS